MGTVIEELIAKIGADTGGFDSGMKNVSNALGNLVGIAGGLSIAGIFTAAIAEASESQQVIAQLNARLLSTKGAAGVTATSALALAASLQKVTRYSDETITSVETMLLQFTRIGKDVFPDATGAALDIATALGIDATSAAKMLGKALEGDANSATALARAGIKLTDAQTKQYKVLVETGQTLKAQKYLLDQITIATGGAARAAGQTFAGQMDILQHSVSDLMESLGGALLPFLTTLIQGFSSFAQSIAPVVAQLAPFLVVVGGIALALSPIGAAVFGVGASIVAIGGAFAIVKEAWDKDIGSIRTAVLGIYSTIKPELDKIGKAVSDFFAVLFAPQKTVGAQQWDIVQLMMKGQASPEEAAGMIAKIVKPDLIGERISKAIDASWPAINAAISALVGKIPQALQTALDTMGASNVDMGKWLATQLVGESNTGKSTAPLDNGLQFMIRNALQHAAGADYGTVQFNNLWKSIPEPDLSTKITNALNKAATDLQHSQALTDISRALDAALNTKFHLSDNLSASLNDLLAWILGDGGKAMDVIAGAIVSGLTNKLGGIGAALKSAFAQGLLAIAEILGKMSGLPFVGPTAGMLRAALVEAVGRASGGPVTGGNPYVVGERGPELFVPRMSGTIVPNGVQAGGGLTIGVVNVYGVQDPAAFYDAMKGEAQRRNVKVNL